MPSTGDNCEIEVEGLYKLTLDLASTASSEEKNLAETMASERLMAHRNLCEDWVAIERVRKQNFFLCGGIELQPEADANKVHADILFTIQRYLTPDIKRHTLAEMLELKQPNGENYTSDKIYSGPWLDNGFITDESLANAELRTQIRLSDIISLIMEIDGVARVKKLHISPARISEEDPVRWLVPVQPGYKPHLKVDDSKLGFFLEDLPVTVSKQVTADIHKDLESQHREQLQAIRSSDLPIPKGRVRNTSDYYSVMNHLPAIYGVGEHGLPASAGPADKNKARQLKAYLLFFDQVMANFNAQVGQLDSLFSKQSSDFKTYAFQLVDSFSEHEKIYKLSENSDSSEQGERIEKIGDTFSEPGELTGESLDRRNRFLDHLIARYGEQTTDFSAALVKMFGANPQTLVRYKSQFLQDFPLISRTRGQAFNYSLSDDQSLWNSSNVSGLERRLAALLGLENIMRRNLSQVQLDQGVSITGNDATGFRFTLRDEFGKRVFTSPRTKFVDRESVEEAAKIALKAASTSSGYRKKSSSNTSHFYQIVDQGQVLATSHARLQTESELNSEIDRVLNHVRAHYSLEGMYLIENVLLQPRSNTDPMMPICVDSDCDDCGDIDPYSYRLHIVLPAYAERFLNMDFRLYVENIIRRETPAHILPKICWASADDIAGLEKALFDWHRIISGKTTARRTQIMQTLIQRLFSIKSVFPTERLVDCDDQESSSRFVIGRTTLGSLHNEEED